jgi:hypothetical protein
MALFTRRSVVNSANSSARSTSFAASGLDFGK